MYSQNNEELVILDYFSKNEGNFFLDIGAYNPFKFSNTRCLYERGWSGVFVEPSPICFKNFVDVYKDETRVTLINAAVSNYAGVITFFEANGDAISTSDISHKEKWEKNPNVTYSSIVVPSISMESLIKEYDKVDFLSLDTEGTNYYLFNLIPDSFLLRLKCLCIEHDGNQDNIESRLAKFNFKRIHFNNENVIFAK
jgi:FkbM family methyltransferase